MSTLTQALKFLVLLVAFAAEAEAAPLDGAFMFLGHDDTTPSLSAAEIDAYFAELQSIQMSTAIIASTRKRGSGGCDSTDFRWIAGLPDRLTSIMNAAQAHGVQVYIGTVLSLESCPTFWVEPNLSLVANDTTKAVEHIQAIVGAHPAFAGYYISDEPGLCYATMIPYYKKIVDIIRAKTPKPIVVSPYLVGVTQQPAEIAAMAKAFLDQTGVTIEAWQDSVGAGAVNVDWGRGPRVEDYYAAIGDAIGADHLWADVELFSHGKLVYFDGAPYSPASVHRLNQQLYAARSASKRVAWLPQFHLGTVDQHRFPGSGRLLDAYRGLYSLGGKVVKPTSYQFLTQPDATYPDAGGELNDTLTADPTSLQDSRWVGIKGNAAVVARIEPSELSWVGVHVYNDAGAGIQTPDSITISCSDGGDAFSLLGTWQRPFAVREHDREYLIANTARMSGVICGAVKIELANPSGAWTFLSEIEIVAAGSASAASPNPAAPTPTPDPAAPANPTTPDPAPANPAPPTMALNVGGVQAPGTLTRSMAYETVFNVCYSRSGGDPSNVCRVLNDVGGSWDIPDGGNACFEFDPKPHMARGSITFTYTCSFGASAQSLNVNVNYTP